MSAHSTEARQIISFSLLRVFRLSTLVCYHARWLGIAVRHATEGGAFMHKPMLWSMVLIVLLVSSTLRIADAGAAERARPIRIGALTDSWGPTPHIVGLRDGLLALGYREPEQFVLGVRFTQEDQTALPAAAHQLVEQAVQAPA